MEKWENIEIINENQLKGHATFNYDQTIILNGNWKFKCILNPDKVDKDFYLDSYDVSSWDEIKVPSCWQNKGYSAPYYFGANFVNYGGIKRQEKVNNISIKGGFLWKTTIC